MWLQLVVTMPYSFKVRQQTWKKKKTNRKKNRDRKWTKKTTKLKEKRIWTLRSLTEEGITELLVWSDRDITEVKMLQHKGEKMALNKNLLKKHQFKLIEAVPVNFLFIQLSYYRLLPRCTTIGKWVIWSSRGWVAIVTTWKSLSLINVKKKKK